jgi:hypothetical protein
MYSPKIKKQFIPILYRIAKEKKMPMTRVVNQIIGDYLTDHLAKKLSERGTDEKETA